MRAAAYDGADFLSLDVEGAELQNANLSAFRVMMVEMGGDDPQKEARIESLLLVLASGSRIICSWVRKRLAGGIRSSSIAPCRTRCRTCDHSVNPAIVSWVPA